MVPTVASAVDLVVHLDLDAGGRRVVREIVARPRPGRAGDRGDRRRVPRPRRPPGPGRRATRRTPSGSPARGSTWPRCCEGGADGGRRRAAARGRGRVHLVVVLGRSRPEPPRRAPPAGTPGPRTRWSRPGSPGVTPGGLVGDERGARRWSSCSLGTVLTRIPSDRAVLRGVRRDGAVGARAGTGPPSPRAAARSSGPRSSTTWGRGSAPGWRCRRPSPRSGSADRSSCARRSRRSPRTTGRPGGSASASTRSRRGSRTPSRTGSSRRCA